MSGGHVAMVLAGLLGVVLTLSVLRAADDAQGVLVAAEDLEPGEVLDDRAVRVAEIRADADALAALVPAADAASVRGQVAVGAVREGELLARADVRDVADGAAGRAMSFAIARAHAVGGDLGRGDRVDVVAVESEGGRSGYVATDVEVVAVDDGGGGPLAGGDELTITVAVDGGTALALAGALQAGSVTLVRATGAAALDGVEPFAPGPGPTVADAAERPPRSP